ncbi:MAG: hypothetical protein EPN97_17075 [Alphaproteobacteria bacterium]|nr:MAG: hypothetical protein EPN97_17075 [Alphaproteobacteria bacterium]
MSKKETTSDLIKVMLSAEVGGEVADWKRLSKRRYYGGDIAREFANTATGERIAVYERQDGLIYAETKDGEKEITARLPFNAAAKPSAVDLVMNRLLESKDCDDDLYAQAVKEGLAKRFSFCITKYDEGIVEEGESPMYTTIYPTVRDETCRVAAYIRPMVPKGGSTDECMVDEWRFTDDLDTPGKIVKYLQSVGMTWDIASQKRSPEVYREICDELGIATPAPGAKNPKP